MSDWTGDGQLERAKPPGSQPAARSRGGIEWDFPRVPASQAPGGSLFPGSGQAPQLPPAGFRHSSRASDMLSPTGNLEHYGL